MQSRAIKRIAASSPIDATALSFTTAWALHTSERLTVKPGGLCSTPYAVITRIPANAESKAWFAEQQPPARRQVNVCQTWQSINVVITRIPANAASKAWFAEQQPLARR